MGNACQRLRSPRIRYDDILEDAVSTLKERLQHPQIKRESFEDYQTVGIIGRGGYGDVLMVTHVKTKEFYAAKRQSKRNVILRNLLEKLQNERLILSAVDFRFIVKLIACCKDHTYVYFITELALAGNFEEHREGTVLTEFEVCFYVGQVVLALEYLHAGDIIHRDIKTSNLLVAHDGYLKLTDFGLSKHMTESKTYSIVGTAVHMAPEVLLQNGHGKGADWWALGTLTYYLLFGKHAFPRMPHINIILQLLPTIIPNERSENARRFVQMLLHQDPNARLGVVANGAAGVKEHAFFSKLKWTKLYQKKYPPPIVNDEDPRVTPLNNAGQADESTGGYEREFEFF